MKTFKQYTEDCHPSEDGVCIDYSKWKEVHGSEPHPEDHGMWIFGMAQVPRGMDVHGDSRHFKHSGRHGDAVNKAKRAAWARRAKTVFLLP